MHAQDLPVGEALIRPFEKAIYAFKLWTYELLHEAEIFIADLE